jgi:hypothetical protein
MEKRVFNHSSSSAALLHSTSRHCTPRPPFGFSFGASDGDGGSTLEGALAQYVRFVAAYDATLTRGGGGGGVPLGPGTLVDFVWHAHQCDPVGYAEFNRQRGARLREALREPAAAAAGGGESSAGVGAGDAAAGVADAAGGDEALHYFDHEPCGEANPPQPEWLDHTRALWKELFPGVPPPVDEEDIGGCCGGYRAPPQFRRRWVGGFRRRSWC